MFIHTWNKYLPVIKILLKRSVNAQQTLDMNKSDFERAAGGKKVKFSFSIELLKGRLRASDNPTQLVKDFVAAMAQDQTTNQFIRQSDLHFDMSNNFKLAIKNTTPVEPNSEITEGEKQDGE